MSDIEKEFSFIIYGTPPSAKNILRRSASGHFYHADNAVACYKRDFARQVPAKFKLNLTGPVSVSMTIYAKDRRKDFHNMEPAIFDALQDAGVILNDRQIVEWQGRGFVDKSSPRVELIIKKLSPT